MADQRKAVLSMGLAQSMNKNHSFGPEFIREMAQQETKKFEAAGFHHYTHLIETPEDITKSIREIRDLLNERRWDAIAIGYGFRGETQLTELFEDTVNACIDVCGPKVRFVFPTLPAAHYESAQRLFSQT